MWNYLHWISLHFLRRSRFSSTVCNCKRDGCELDSRLVLSGTEAKRNDEFRHSASQHTMPQRNGSILPLRYFRSVEEIECLNTGLPGFLCLPFHVWDTAIIRINIPSVSGIEPTTTAFTVRNWSDCAKMSSRKSDLRVYNK